MSNIVPQTNEEGQLGREGRRWASVHAKLASLDQVTFAGTADASPGPSSLWVNAEGVLHFGDSALALGGDVGQITALTELFFGDNADGGVHSQLDFINENFDTLVEVANGLSTLTNDVTTLNTNLGNLDTVVGDHTTDIAAQSELITTLTNSLTTLTENFNNRLSLASQQGAVVTLAGSTLGPSSLYVGASTITASGMKLGDSDNPFRSLALGNNGSSTTLSTDATGRLLANGEVVPHTTVAYGSNIGEISVLTEDDVLSPSGLRVINDELNVPSEIIPREGVGGPIPLNLGSDNSRFNKIFCEELFTSSNSVFIGDTKLSSVGATLSVGTLSGTAQPVVLQPQLTSAIAAEVAARDSAISAAISPVAASLSDVINTVSTLEEASGSLTMNGLLDTDLAGVASGDILQYNGSDWVPSDVRVDTTAGTAYVVSGNVAINYQSAADSITKQTTTTWIDEVVITNQFWAPNADGNNDYFVLDMSALDKSEVTLIPATSSLDNFALDTTPESVVDFLGLTADVYYFWSVNGKTWLYNTTGFPATANELALSPRTDLGVSLGSPDKRFKDLYLSGNSIVIGDATISASGSTLSTNGAAIALASELNSAVSTLTASINSEATARAAGDAALASSLSSVQTTLEGQISTLETSVASSLSALDADLSAETTRALLAETALASSINALETSLSASITAEETRATAAESALQGAIDSTGSDLAFLQSEVDAEITRATDAEAALQAQITANSVSLGAVAGDVAVNAASISTVAANLASEVTRATGAESALASSLSALSGRVADIISNSDPAALDSLTEIVTAFQSADSNLNSAITTLAADRESALSAHISANAASFSALSTSIAAEVTRATNAESALQTQITANSVSVGAVASDLADEVTRATDAEAVLAASINALQLSAATLSSDLAAEVTRATGVEAALAASITQNAADITSTNIVLSDLQTTVSQLDTGEATSAAISALETELNTVEQSAFGNVTGAYPTASSAHYISAASNLHNATVLLDTALKAEETARINGLSSKQDALTLVSPMTFNGATLSIISGSFATPAEVSAVASSLSALTDRVGDLEGAPAISLDTTGSSALSYDTESGTLALVDASINAGTAASLASNVELSLSGSVSGSVSFSSGGAYTITTTLSETYATAASLSALTANVATIDGLLTGRIYAIEQDYLTSSSTLSASNLDVSSLSIAGVDVSLGGSISAATIQSALDLSAFATSATLSNYVTSVDLSSTLAATLSHYALTSYVDAQVASLVDSSPEALNTLNELAAALGDDPNFATTISTQLGVVSASITSLQGSVSTLSADLLDEVTRATTAEGALSTSLSTLSADLLDEVTARTSADSVLASSITSLNNSVASLTSADVVLASSITSLQGDVTSLFSADVVLASSIDALQGDISTLQAADTTLQSNIDNVTDNVNALSDALDDEVARATAAESALSSSISNESTTRASADTTLQGNIDAETTARTSGDATLQGNISAEATARASADTTLQGNIDAEASARAAADTTLGSRIDELTTDDIAEGTAQYYTNARARGAISVVVGGGDGSLTYNSSTGELTYTGPSSSDVTQYLAAGDNITLTGGTFSLASLLTNVVVQGHLLESFDHGTVTEAHDNVLDCGSVVTNVEHFAVDFGCLDNGSLF
jgi:hypothetical protein